MTGKRPSPLAGYNTSVQHRGAPYHVQTEDSGVDHPHVITHLFAHGGRIVATRKTSYAEHVGTAAYPAAVQKIIRAQHKDMIVRLREGTFDSLLGLTPLQPLPAPGPASSPRAPDPEPQPDSRPAAEPAAKPAAEPKQEAPRASPLRSRRASFPKIEPSGESLDDIILGDLIRHFDE